MSAIRRIFAPPQQPQVIMPPAPTPPPTMPDPGSATAIEEARSRMMGRRKGRSSTILSGEGGGSDAGATYTKAKLGG